VGLFNTILLKNKGNDLIMNYELPFGKHKWFTRPKLEACACGCKEYIIIDNRKWCLEKIKLLLKQHGYVLIKNDELKKSLEQKGN
jgi:hypothetical protein